jgi:tetratricopeptide (TPR) repeat protein
LLIILDSKKDFRKMEKDKVELLKVCVTKFKEKKWKETIELTKAVLSTQLSPKSRQLAEKMLNHSEKKIQGNDFELLKKFQKILNMTQEVKKSEVAKSLGISEEILFEKLVEWSHLGFKLKNDLIIVEDIFLFTESLDHQFGKWVEKEKTKDGKVEDYLTDLDFQFEGWVDKEISKDGKIEDFILRESKFEHLYPEILTNPLIIQNWRLNPEKGANYIEEIISDILQDENRHTWDQLIVLTYCNFFKKEWDTGNSFLDKALKIESNNHIILTAKAYSLFHEKKYSQALEILKRAEVLPPMQGNKSSIEFITHLQSLIYYFTGRPKQSEELCSQILANNKEYSHSWQTLGYIAQYAKKDIKTAESYYQKAIQLNPFNSELWNELGYMNYLHSKNFEEAERCYRKSIKIDSSNSLAWNNLGILYYNVSANYKSAEEYYRTAIEKNKLNPLPWYNLGILYNEQFKRYPEAEKYYKKVIEINPNKRDIWYALGNLYRDMDKLELAINSYKKGIEIRPNDYKLWLNLGSSYLDKDIKMIDDAEECLLKSLKIKPDEHLTLYNLGYLNNFKKLYPDARKYYEQSIQCNSKYAKSWFGLGEINLNEEKYEQARNCFAQCLLLDPTFIDAEEWIEKINSNEVLKKYHGVSLLKMDCDVLEFLEKQLRTIIPIIPVVDNFTFNTFGYMCQKQRVDCLSLYGKGYVYLPDKIQDLKCLRMLYLENNMLAALPDWFGNFPNLGFISLKGNNLTMLPESIGNLSALSGLILSINKLQQLPENIGKLSALTYLNLGENRLYRIPESIGKLTALTALHLNDNELTILPVSIGNLTSLQELNLLENHISAIPESIGLLNSLTCLDLMKNQLTNLPESIIQITSLTDFSFEKDKLKRFSKDIKKWLNNLKIAGCDIKSNEAEYIEGARRSYHSLMFGHDRFL